MEREDQGTFAKDCYSGGLLLLQQAAPGINKNLTWQRNWSFNLLAASVDVSAAAVVVVERLCENNDK